MDFSYLGDVVASVTALKDRRAVPSLVAMIGTGNLATDGLADLGEYAVPMVVEALDSEETIARAGATTTLGKIAQRRSELGLGAGTVATIRAVLMSALEDESFMVRRRAIAGLMSYSGDDIRRAMEQLEASDPYQNPAGRWTVRVAALEWLERHRDAGGTGYREHKVRNVLGGAAYTQRGHLTRSWTSAVDGNGPEVRSSLALLTNEALGPRPLGFAPRGPVRAFCARRSTAKSLECSAGLVAASVWVEL